MSKPSASDHGEKIDLMLFITFAITGLVFLLTQILLFWFVYKYQFKEKRKIYFFAHDNKLELIWTVDLKKEDNLAEENEGGNYSRTKRC